MSIVFLGDVAYPSEDLDVVFNSGSPDICIFNLEGYISDQVFKEGKGSPSEAGVFNSRSTVNALKESSKKIVVGLANNHILDSNDLLPTLKYLSDNDVECIGAGLNSEDAAKYVVVVAEGVSVAVLAFGWDLIGCQLSSPTRQGVSSASFNVMKDAVLKIKENPNIEKLAVFVHWGFELEQYPLPMHRTMARMLIDLGVDIVVGGHAHCIQGMEYYKEKPIFYGLGNAAFRESYYYSGKIRFPVICQEGISVAWSPKDDSVKVARCELISNRLVVSRLIDVDQHNELMDLSRSFCFAGKDYINWFKKNRRKKKFLPVFVRQEGTWDYFWKAAILRGRTIFISLLLRVNLKSGPK